MLAVFATNIFRSLGDYTRSARTRVVRLTTRLQVRTARVMLVTDPARAVAEVAHELMHAAHTGLIWPDEPFIARALQSEVSK